MNTEEGLNNEIERLHALREYDILDTAAEEELDALTKLASSICDVPIALITIIDENRQWFKSKVGMEETETAREIAFCNHAIKGDDLYEVENATKNPLFSENPFVTSDPNIRFYAGAPLVNPDGYKLGTLCVLDTVPRILNDKQKETLRLLSRFIIEHFELRKKTRQLKESRKDYDSLIENSADVIYTCDFHGNFTFVNQRVKLMLGYSAQELIGRNFKDLIPEEDRTRVADFYVSQIRNNVRDSVLEFPVMTRHGERKWIEQTVTMISNENTRFSGFQSIVRDINDRKQSEHKIADFNREIEATRNMLQSVLDNTSSLIFIRDLQHRYLLVNTQYEKTYRVAFEDIYMKTDYTFRPKEVADEMVRTDKIVFETNKPVTQEQIFNFEDRKLTMLTTKVPLFNEKGELYALCGIATDITHQKDIQERLEERDRRFSALFESSPVALTLGVVNPNRLVEVNKAYEELTGFTREEAIGKNSAELGIISHEERERVFKLFNQHGSLKNYEMEITTRSGERKDVMVTSDVIQIDGQSFILNVYQDITTSNRDRKELTRIKNLLAETMSIGHIGSFEVNLITKEVTWSKEMYDIMEMPYDSKPPGLDENMKMLHPDDYDDARERIANLVRTRITVPSVTRFVMADGQIKYIEIRSVVTENEDGSPMALRGTMQDITEKKILENELRTAKELAEQSMAAKENFLANMSHEIRTPMNAVLGFTDLLMETSLDVEQRDYVHTIQTSGKNLMAIINDILDYSKIEAGMMRIEKVPVSVRALFGSLNILLGQRAKEKNLKLSFEVDPAIPETLMSDPTRFTQIITNLVGNAVKFTEKGGIYVKAKLLQDKDDVSLIRVSVEDTGIGISEEQQAAVFERFNQGSNDTTRKYGGTGLGLSIVKKLVELQGGVLSLTSTLGKGSVFEFTLPMEHYKGDEIATIASLSSSKTVKPNRVLHVLLAEDNVINQKLAEKHLHKFGYTVDIAGNGRIAIEKLEKTKYDIILMDMQMPEMDGYETSVHIRKQLKLETPIIAMTAHAMTGEKEKCLSMGMNEYISKPFKADELYQKINELVGGEVKDNTKLKSNTLESTHKLISMVQLEELSEGETEFIKDMLQLFTREIPENLRLLNEAISKEDYSNIEYMAHKMKSSVLMLGLQDSIGSTLTEMEKQGRLKSPLNEVKREYSKVEKLCQRVLEEVKEELNKR